jgi:hypothetical protein
MKTTVNLGASERVLKSLFKTTVFIVIDSKPEYIEFSNNMYKCNISVCQEHAFIYE